MPSRGIDCRNTFRGLTVPQHQNEFIPEVTQEWLRFETGLARLPICFLAIRSAHDGRTIDGDVQRVLSAVTGNRLAIDIRANVLVLETTAGTGHRDSDSEPKFVAAAVARIRAKGMNRIGEAADFLAAVELSENLLHFERNFCHVWMLRTERRDFDRDDLERFLGLLLCGQKLLAVNFPGANRTCELQDGAELARQH